MKTEVKFRELPEKVQSFLIRMFGYSNDSNPTIKLEWLHNLPEWSEATDNERLAYAEWRYPVGTKYNNAHPDDKTGVFILEERCYKVNYLGEENSIGTNGQGWVLWKNKWAELVSEPEEKQYRIEELAQAFNNRDRFIELKEASQEAQQEFVKANPGMQHVEGFEAGKIVNVWNRDDKVDFQPAKYRFFADGKHWVETCSADLVINFKNIEKIADSDLKEVEEPKAGDMVEVSDDGIDWKKYQRHTHTYRGIKRLYDGHFICENQDGFISTFKFIRLPQKSEVESKAKQLMLNYSGHNEIPSANYKHDSVMKMLIDICKWGQANPSKI